MSSSNSTIIVGGGLAGLTAASILRRAGHTVRETFFGRDAIYAADEVFMTGTAAEVTPIRELDRRPIGAGSRGPITRAVQDTYLRGVRGEVDWMRDYITSYEL